MLELRKKQCFGRDIRPCPKNIMTRTIPNTLAIVAKIEGRRFIEKLPMKTRYIIRRSPRTKNTAIMIALLIKDLFSLPFHVNSPAF